MTLEAIYTANKEMFNALANEDLAERLIKSPKFTFGNFDHYYNPSESESGAISVKEKLDILPKDWFANKKILDIG
jgi:hypothetical protein